MRNVSEVPLESSTELAQQQQHVSVPTFCVAVLTGGGDKPYAFGLATELIRRRLEVDIIGGDELDLPEFRNQPGVRFLNLRGDQSPEAGVLTKILRVLAYYFKLLRYAATSRAKIFHILWNNKFQTIDRTLLMIYYKMLQKQILLTVHNVNVGKRDANDSWLNRLTLRIQYQLADHLFVHTAKMRQELDQEFKVPAQKVTIIPFGINNSVPNTNLTPSDARKKLGIHPNERTILFFGNIAPYKGLEYLVAAFQEFAQGQNNSRLIIAGRPKDCDDYWKPLRASFEGDIRSGKILLKLEYIPDEETEIYCKASDVLVLPYTHIYQSGVLFLSHSFGLPVLASDVGSLRDDIIDGVNGFMFLPSDTKDLLKCLQRYFDSALFRDLDGKRDQIRDDVARRHSWELVGQITTALYCGILGLAPPGTTPGIDSSSSTPGRNAHA